MSHLLERYPATAGALPIAWDGQDIAWGEWSTVAAFICARSAKKSYTTCEHCGHDPQVSLVIQGHVGDRQLMLLRCPDCGADTVVDWEQTVWDLDESDYGPDGSWDDEAPTLFETPAEPPRRCSRCGREGDTGMAVDSTGTHRCADDELCARRARARRKDS